MKRYWDSSAIIKAIHSPQLEPLTRQPGQVTRTHSLSEVFSTLTGGRLGFKYMPDDAAELIKEITSSFEFVDLSAAETQVALSKAQKKGVRGGRIHDWIHAVAARKAGVQELLTDNISDFAGLEDGYKNVRA